jgi:hypothetical protein
MEVCGNEPHMSMQSLAGKSRGLQWRFQVRRCRANTTLWEEHRRPWMVDELPFHLLFDAFNHYGLSLGARGCLFADYPDTHPTGIKY